MAWCGPMLLTTVRGMEDAKPGVLNPALRTSLYPSQSLRLVFWNGWLRGVRRLWLQVCLVLWLQLGFVATDRVKRLRCSSEQESRWLAAAGGGRRFSAWARLALDRAAELESALGRQARVEGARDGGLAGRTAARRGEGSEGSVETRAEAVRPASSSVPRSGRRATAGAGPGLCVHRVPLDAYCKSCV